ncbi:hypothetical protein Poly41_40170 [Novipirellula artificiosorum]|uniref:YHS domain protein n=2 Tax=Novipirellula artificiosorum TaxID=2528016 RepID=A0A5C6DFW9_9BACT|nr:hypothetical protein Poly41_40170 [Novipirellula artificiosorum]
MPLARIFHFFAKTVKKPSRRPSKGVYAGIHFGAKQNCNGIKSVLLAHPQRKMKLLIPTTLALILMAGIYGCNSPESDSLPASPSAIENESGDHDSMNHDEHEHEGHDHAQHDAVAKTDMEKMTEALADLPPEDRESAMKQHFCPVSGEMLGVMGEPEKVEVKGQTVWICCDGCKDKLLADPDKYLAKINK